MNKIVEFYTKALENEETKKELIMILGEKKFEEADDTQLEKIGEVAKKLGYEITIEEAKAYLNKEDAELDAEDLDAVAGGKGETSIGNCGNGVGGIIVDL